MRKSYSRTKRIYWNSELELGEKAKEDEILKLVQLVDSNFRFTPFVFFFRGSNAFAFVAFIEFFVLIAVFLVFAPSLYEKIVVAISFSAFGIAFFLSCHGFSRSI